MSARDEALEAMRRTFHQAWPCRCHVHGAEGGWEQRGEPTADDFASGSDR